MDIVKGSGSHRWFPSPKQISGFHNQNPCENLNIGQALLEHLDSWSTFTLRPTAVESYYFSNFGFLNEEIDPKNGIYAKNWAR